MRLTANRDALLKACQALQQVTPARATMPVYQNAKAVGTPDGLTLMATDLEVGLRYDLKGPAVADPGEAILPLAKLVAILREAPGDEVDLTADARRVAVTTAAGEYEMAGEDPGTFADVAEFDPADGTVEVAAADLSRLVRRTAFAAARDEGKYAMRGVLWDLAGRELRLVATDGKRIATATAPARPTGEAAARDDGRPASHLVPPKATALLDRLLGDGDPGQAVRVALRPNDALFRTERATVYTRLVEGRFPPWREVIPKKPKATVPLMAGDFLAAIRRAAVMTDADSKRVEFAFGPGTLSLNAQGPTTGKGTVRGAVPADGYAGPPVTISFDPAYLTEMLRALDPADPLTLELVDDQRPGVFRVGPDYLYLVVPLI